MGIAIPYGNSNSIPFSKSFFAGGPNDNRAWSAYSLGPGSSESTNEFNEANFKLAFSVEQRFNVFGDLNGALFGFGLRYDFSFFIFRFDVGFKTYNPSISESSRWFSNYNFTEAVYNIGINYPF